MRRAPTSSACLVERRGRVVESGEELDLSFVRRSRAGNRARPVARGQRKSHGDAFIHLNRRHERARDVVQGVIEGTQRVLDAHEDARHDDRALPVPEPFSNLLGDRLQRHRLVDEPDRRISHGRKPCRKTCAEPSAPDSIVIRSSLHFDGCLVELHSAWEA
jgi:hypothetical protein